MSSTVALTITVLQENIHIDPLKTVFTKIIRAFALNNLLCKASALI